MTANFLAGRQLLIDGKFHEAIECFQTEPENSVSYLLAQGNLGQSFIKLGNFPEAEEILEVVVALMDSQSVDPESQVQFLRDHAESIQRQGRAAESIAHHSSAIKAVDTFFETHPDLERGLLLAKACALNAKGTAFLTLNRDRNDLERARELFTDSLDLFRQHLSESKLGLAEVLTNLGHVLRKFENPGAEPALLEALEVVSQTKDFDQRNRVVTALLKLGSTHFKIEEWFDLLNESVLDAEQQDNYVKAHQRCVIAAQIALESGNIESGIIFADKAFEIEKMALPFNWNFCQLRRDYADLVLAKSQDNLQTALLRLIGGCHIWFELICRRLEAGDFNAHSTMLHEHFRHTTQLLLEGRRDKEAFLVFEIGRALRHALEANPNFLDEVVGNNPFSRDGKIDLRVIERLFNSVPCDAHEISTAIIPPNLLAFIANTNGVQIVSVPVGSNCKEDLVARSQELPKRLQLEDGSAAIPEVISDLAKLIVANVGDRKITRFAPHFWLHNVPWRTLLRFHGMLWPQLVFPIVYGLLIGVQNELKKIDLTKITALGYGTAGPQNGVDLNSEARAFSEQFGDVANFHNDANATEFRDALSHSSIVFISCHGKESGNELELQLASSCRTKPEWYPLGPMVSDTICAELVILSACYSGVFKVRLGDYPVGGVPQLLRAGVQICIGCRFEIRSAFSEDFFRVFQVELSAKNTPLMCFIAALSEVDDNDQYDLWRDLACIEFFGS